MDRSTKLILAGLGAAAIPAALLLGGGSGGVERTGAPPGGLPPWDAVKKARAALPDIPGKVVKHPPGIMYMGNDDAPHIAYLRDYLDKAAAAESNTGRKRGILAFRALQGREGSTSALNTYDNMVVTWGTGWGGLGLLPQVLERLAGTPAAAAMVRNGLRYAGQREYELLDGAGKVVKGKSNALQALRATPELLKLLVDLARNPATRDAVTRAQLDTFLKYGGNVAAQEQAATQALFNFVAHLQHWAPGFANGALAWAAKQVPGAPSSSRDVQLAARVLEYFYSKAKKAGGWIPSFAQAKGYWKDMIKDGLGEASGHPLLSSTEPPESIAAAVGAWGPEARAASIFSLINALSDGSAEMQTAVIRAAKAADGTSPDRPNVEAIGQALAWARHKYGPAGLREDNDRAVQWIALLGAPWFGIEMPRWAQWQQELANFIDEHRGNDFSEAAFGEADGYRRQFNEWAAKFRANGIAVADIAEKKLEPLTPTTADIDRGLDDLKKKAGGAALGYAVPIALGAAGALYLASKFSGRRS